MNRSHIISHAFFWPTFLLAVATCNAAAGQDESTDASAGCAAQEPGLQAACLASAATEDELDSPPLEPLSPLTPDPNEPSSWSPVTLNGTCSASSDNPGDDCLDDEDCPGGTCETVESEPDRYCVGGSNADALCVLHSDCPGGECQMLTCEGGTQDLEPCVPGGAGACETGGGTCVVWDSAYEIDDTVTTEVDGDPGCFPDECEGGVGTVYPPDERVRIRNTKAKPWRWIGRLEMTFPDGARGSCSGALISKRHVLTAGHCIYSHAHGGWARKVKFSPGQNGKKRPFGRWRADRLATFRGWIKDRDSWQDMAVVRLKPKFGKHVGNRTGWFGMVSGVADVPRIRNLSGYPGDKRKGQQWFDWDPTCNRTHCLLQYCTDTFSGQSGSPVWRYRASTGSRHIRAVHTLGGGGTACNPATCGPNRNSGTRLTRGKHRAIRRYLKATGASAVAAGACVDCGPDCNENGIGDATDISGGTSTDTNANGIPDECEGACCFPNGSCDDTLSALACIEADANAAFLAAGTTCAGDADGDGIDDNCKQVFVPATSEWGLATLTLLTLAGGTLVLRRRRMLAA